MPDCIKEESKFYYENGDLSLDENPQREARNKAWNGVSWEPPSDNRKIKQ